MKDYIDRNMMIRFVFLLVLFTSCESKVAPHQISGSWKTRDLVDKTNLNASDRMTFYNGDSIKIEIFTNNQLFNQIKGTYKLDSAVRLLTTMYNDTAFTYHILQLNEEEMELKDCGNKRVIRFVRDKE